MLVIPSGTSAASTAGTQSQAQPSSESTHGPVFTYDPETSTGTISYDATATTRYSSAQSGNPNDTTKYQPWYNLEGDDVTNRGTIRPYINNPVPVIQHRKALGDSFSAGPGAGADYDESDPYQCMRNWNAYPPQLWSDHRFYYPSPQPNEPDVQTTFVFLSCTGAVAPDLLAPSKNIQIPRVSQDDEMITLSIGGNDVEFVEILKACVYRFTEAENACNKQLARSRSLIFGETLRQNHQRVVHGIWDQLQWQHRSTQYTAVYQTGYSQFFDVWTDDCNSHSFLPLFYNGPKMIMEIRSTLNNLVHQENYMLEYYVAWNNLDLAGNRAPGQRILSFIDWVDVDTVYNGHRFCRTGVTEPDRHNDDTWFFHFADGHLKDASNDNTSTQVFPEWVAETFHPKSAGHGASKDLLFLKTKFEVFARRLSGYQTHPFGQFVWMIGDDVCYASQRQNSDIYGGYRTFLQNIMLDPHLYGWDRFDSSQGGFRTFYIGQNQAPAGFRHDCYKGQQIDKIYDNIRQAAQHTAYQNKIVILSVGTMDLFLGYDLDKAHRKVSRILTLIFKYDPTATVLLIHVPMFGIKEQGRVLEKKKNLQNVVEFNARLSGLANYWRTRYGRRVLKVSLPLTTWHKEELMLPNRHGYNAMAWAIAEQLVFAASMDWIVNSYVPHAPAPGPAIPGPPSPNTAPARDPPPTPPTRLHRRGIPDPGYIPPELQLMSNPVTDGSIVCTQKRPDGAPSGVEILKSLAQGSLDISAWVSEIGCNTTEICKNSIFNTAPEAYWDYDRAPNGTMCLGGGGSDTEGWDDLTQVMIRRPTGDVDINANNKCHSALLELLEKCILNETYYGGYRFSSPDDLGGKKILYNITNTGYPADPMKHADVSGVVTDQAYASRVIFDDEKPNPTLFYTSPDPLPTDDEWI